MRTPTPAELRAAFVASAEVRFGFPVVVDMGDDGVAVLDLTAAYRRDPDPWLVTRVGPGEVVDLTTAGDRGLYVDGMSVAADDMATVEAALAEVPREVDRHEASSDGRRMLAGRHALRVRDAMVRARLLDAVDGWSALREGSVLVDEDPAHGTLVQPSAKPGRAGRILLVRCPSTGRAYAHRVPAALTTAKTARLWLMGDNWMEPPEVET